MPGWNGTLAQRFAIVLGMFFLVTGISGLITNPDFGTGAHLTSKQLLIDWNGWHAVSALALAPIAFTAAARPHWAMVFLAGNAIGNVAESVWAMIDRTPLGLLYFPNVVTDAALHFVVAALSAVAFFVQLGPDHYRRTAPRTHAQQNVVRNAP